MKKSKVVRAIAFSMFMFLGLFLGLNTPIKAQTDWYPCGRCDFDTYADDPHLGDIGFCSYVIPGVVNGCTHNDGSPCSNGQCSKLDRPM
ncbi:MAG: hypothetical protein FH748_08040 [Balneolaceae bacterium]|nr:hypothetical protein [Balneolaceae bacterium]